MSPRKPLRFSRALVALPVFAAALAAVSAPAGAQAPVSVTVQVDQPGVKISPDLYGLMTEEINHAYDGGLYGELIQNRAFKDDRNSPVHWTVVQNGGASTVALDSADPVSAALGQSLKWTITSASDGQKVGIANDGFWGIPVKPSTTYKASFYAQGMDGFSGPLTVSLESADGATVYATATVNGIGSAWKQYAATLKTGANVTPSKENRFVIRAARAGTVRFSLISLFPPTYANRANGNRIDLMQMMADMKPAFLRLPGGNYVDPGHYIWKNTIGPLEQRPGSPGAWGYHVSEGLGILEYMEWCEDLHMQPLLAVTDGRPYIPANGDVAPLVQDALDEIEYVTGDPKTTVWGARRAKDGHPAPFPLHYVEIGNEDFFDKREVYDARFTKFFDAIRAKYPNLKIIATRGDVTSRVPDIIDEHYYRSAADMEKNAHQYDTYSRTGPKIFVGEWASTEGSPTPTMQAALGDAAWMTGMERNSDIVILESYAPLLVNVNPGARQWGTNLIGYDALNSFGSPSYYVQKMFGTMHGDTSLPTTVQQTNVVAATTPPPTGGVGVGTWLTQAEFKDLKVTNGATVLYQSSPTASDLTGLTPVNGAWKARDGVFSQTDNQENDRLLVGSPDWTNYTFTLKARKTGGDEGFLVLFHTKNENDYRWLNLGGWGNTRTEIERDGGSGKSEIGRPSNATVETGRWYDIRVEVKGADVKCYLDNKLIVQAKDAPATPPPPVYASANRDRSGNLFLRVVNVAATPQAITLNLAGAKSVDKKATGETIAGEPGDVNTIEAPEKVAPQTLTIDDAGKTFTHTFPAHSVTVLKMKVK